MKCPLCNGTGKTRINLDTDNIKKLSKKGLSIRQIAKIIGKGSTTVYYHIHKKD